MRHVNDVEILPVGHGPVDLRLPDLRIFLRVELRVGERYDGEVLLRYGSCRNRQEKSQRQSRCRPQGGVPFLHNLAPYQIAGPRGHLENGGCGLSLHEGESAADARQKTLVEKFEQKSRPFCRLPKTNNSDKHEKAHFILIISTPCFRPSWPFGFGLRRAQNRMRGAGCRSVHRRGDKQHAAEPTSGHLRDQRQGKRVGIHG